MKDEILEDVEKELNWKERIIMKLLKKYTYKIFKLGITFGVNNK